MRESGIYAELFTLQAAAYLGDGARDPFPTTIVP
jgi:hypothetical protein